MGFRNTLIQGLISLPLRAHAAELGNPVPEEPLLFLKPTTSYLQEGGSIVVSEGLSRLILLCFSLARVTPGLRIGEGLVALYAFGVCGMQLLAPKRCCSSDGNCSRA